MVVTGIGMSPSPSVVGEPITFYATVINIGNAPTPSGAVIEVSFLIDGAEVSLSNSYSSSLVPGQWATLQANSGPNGKSTWLATAGTHRLEAWVNSAGLFPESNTSNNTDSLNFTPQSFGLPDMVVTGITMAPSAPSAGQSIQFYATVLNQGNAPTPSGVTIGVAFLVDGKEVTWSDNYSKSLPPQGWVTLSANSGPSGSASWMATPGTHTLEAWVNDIGRFPESNTSNNTLNTTFSVSSTYPAVQARSADDFVNSIGVGTHLGYLDEVYGTGYSTIIEPRLIEMGVRHIRDGMTEWPDVYAKMNELATHGIKIQGVCEPSLDSRGNPIWTDASAVIAGATQMQGAVESFEGPNEVDNNFGPSPNWENDLATYQKALYAAVKSNPIFSRYPVLGGALGGSDRPQMLFDVVGMLSAYMDFGSMHPYPITGTPTNGLQTNITNYQTYYTGTHPLIASETGYHNAIDNTNPNTQWWPGISYPASGKYIPRIYLEYFNAGITRTFIYELIDEKANSTDSEMNFGMLMNDGTPKPSFTAVKDLVSILSDPGPSFTPRTLSYSLNNPPALVHHTLLAKRNGTVDLILWQDAVSFDTTTMVDVSVPTQPVTVSLGDSFSVANIYDPTLGSVASSQILNPSQFTVQVPDHPLVIELIPSGAVPTVSKQGLIGSFDASVANGGVGPYTNGCGSNSDSWFDLSPTNTAALLSSNGIAPTSCINSGWAGNGTPSSPYSLATSASPSLYAVQSSSKISVPMNAFSVEAWFRTTSKADQSVVGISGNIEPIGTNGGDLKAVLDGWTTSSISVADGNWHHVITVGDATSVRMYLDGNATPVLTLPPSANLISGPIGIGVLPTAGYELTGNVAIVRVYNRPLSIYEIKQNCTAGQSRFSSAKCSYP